MQAEGSDTMHLDGIKVTPTTWRGSDAFRLTSRALELVVVTRGGHIASVTTTGRDDNPLWQPPWPSSDPAHVSRTVEGTYGAGPEAPTLAAIVGHNLCLDRFGAPWPADDRPTHGEAGIVTWQLGADDSERVTFRASLPIAELAVERRFSASGPTCRVETRVRSTGGSQRAIEWAEHPTVGDPFLDGAHFSAGIDCAYVWPTESDGASSAMVPDLAAILDVPEPGAPARGDVFAGRVRDGFWQAHNPRLGHTLTYRWDPTQFPWLAIWTEHESRASAPWNGVTRARALEFATKPFPEGLPPAARRDRFDDRPTSLTLSPDAVLERWFELTWE